MAKKIITVFLDSINIGEISYMPSLALLGLWWGRVGRKEQYENRLFALGLLALLLPVSRRSW